MCAHSFNKFRLSGTLRWQLDDIFRLENVKEFNSGVKNNNISFLRNSQSILFYRILNINPYRRLQISEAKNFPKINRLVNLTHLPQPFGSQFRLRTYHCQNRNPWQKT